VLLIGIMRSRMAVDANPVMISTTAVRAVKIDGLSPSLSATLP
jgi:hypothetical protein